MLLEKIGYKREEGARGGAVGWDTTLHYTTLHYTTLHYKAEGVGFDYWYCNWNSSVTHYFRPHYGLVVDSDCNRNE